MLKANFDVDLSPMENLKKSLTNKILRQSMREASQPVLQAVKSNAKQHVRLGYLVKVLKLKMRTYKTGIVSIVGPQSDKVFVLGIRKRGKSIGQPIRYRPSAIVHLLEKGTKRAAARPIMTPAINSQRQAYFDRLSTILSRKIQEELSK
jgi:HK97 gp10 family phage protein